MSLDASSHAITASGTSYDDSRQALNFLDNVVYPHHPVMRRLPRKVYKIDREHLVEFGGGLRVPARFDCDNFNNGSSFGNHYYFFEVPSRWLACRQHEAALLSGLPYEAPERPIVDDEYHEHVAVFHSVLRAVHAFHRSRRLSSEQPRPFVFGELGARWGTWGARAASLARQLAPTMPTKLYFVEAHEPNCDALREVMARNHLSSTASYTLDCARATASKLRGWAETVDHIDALDLDLQGFELRLVPQVIEDVLEPKVARLIVGTHSHFTHHTLRGLFMSRGWREVWAVPYQTRACQDKVKLYLRGNYKTGAAALPQRFNWTALRHATGDNASDPCVHSTPRGPVAHWDGELIVDNPRFVNVTMGFTMADAVVRQDLL